MDKETKGTLLAFATALISGIAIPVNKLFVLNMDPTLFTAARGLIVGMVFLVIAWRTGKLNKQVAKGYKSIYFLFIGLLGGGLAFLFYFHGLQLTTASHGAFLHKTLPLFTTILAIIFLKEKVRSKQLLALGLMFLGIFSIYFSGIRPTSLWSDPSLGDLLIIFATILWAIENVISKKVMVKGESNFIVSAARMLIGSLLLFWILVFSQTLDALFVLSFNQVLSLLVSTGILFGYVYCWYYSIKLINVSKAAAILLLSPVISMILGIVIFKEPAPMNQLMGSIAILFGAYLISKVKSEFVEGM